MTEYYSTGAMMKVGDQGPELLRLIGSVFIEEGGLDISGAGIKIESKPIVEILPNGLFAFWPTFADAGHGGEGALRACCACHVVFFSLSVWISSRVRALPGPLTVGGIAGFVSRPVKKMCLSERESTPKPLRSPSAVLVCQGLASLTRYCCLFSRSRRIRRWTG